MPVDDASLWNDLDRHGLRAGHDLSGQLNVNGDFTLLNLGCDGDVDL